MGQRCEANMWRVCYQWGLPHLVFTPPVLSYCTVSTVQCRLCTVQCTVYSAQCVMYSGHFILYIVQWTAEVSQRIHPVIRQFLSGNSQGKYSSSQNSSSLLVSRYFNVYRRIIQMFVSLVTWWILVLSDSSNPWIQWTNK